MKKKKEHVLVTAILISFMILSQLALVSAITGSMGNARMVLYPEVNGLINTIIDKSILVKNVNDVAIDIRLEIDEGSTDFLELVDEEFTLQPGEEKKAGFKVKVKDSGKYEGKINVFFSEAGNEESGGVVLSSNIIVIAKGPNDYEEENEEDETNEESNSEDPITGGAVLEDKRERNPIAILLTITTIILIIILIILFILSGKKRKKEIEKKKVEKEESKPKKSKKSHERKKTSKK